MKNFIARFIVAHRSSLVAMQELNSLGIDEKDSLFCACVKKENNEKTVNDLLESKKLLEKEKLELQNKVLSLETTNSLLQVVKEEWIKEKDTLNTKVLSLTTKVTVNRLQFFSTIFGSICSLGSSIVGGLFSGGKGPVVLAMLYLWWKFS